MKGMIAVNGSGREHRANGCCGCASPLPLHVQEACRSFRYFSGRPYQRRFIVLAWVLAEMLDHKRASSLRWEAIDIFPFVRLADSDEQEQNHGCTRIRRISWRYHHCV